MIKDEQKDISYWIKKINELEPKPTNRFDKGGHNLLACMDYYRVTSLSVLSEEQLKSFYEIRVKAKRRG